MKTANKLIALLLSVLMCLSLFTCFASADDEYNIVALGDSTANGFNLDDYGYYSEDDDFVINSSYNAYGFLGLASKSAYPERLRQYLSEKMPGTTVNVKSLTVRGMRSDEIRKILEPDFENDNFGKSFMSELNYAFKTCYDIPDPTAYYTDALREADLITLDCCMNNFANYLIDRVLACMKNDADQLAFFADDSAEKLFAALPESSQELYEGYITKLLAAFSGALPEGTVREIADAVGYCYADFCVNFSAIIRDLREINPDARIIVGGTYNPLAGHKLMYKGIEIDLGNLLFALMDLVDTYITALDPNSAYYSFAKAPEIEAFIACFAGLNSTAELNQVMLERMITSIYHPRQMKLIDVMNGKVAAEAQKRGIDLTDAAPVDDTDVIAAYARVKDGTATDLDKLLYDVTERFLEPVLYSARVMTLDLEGLLTGLTGDINPLAVEICETPIAELTDAQLAILHLTALSSLAEASGIHPSYTGADQKFEAFKKAYDENKPASSSSADIIKDMGKKTAWTAFNAIKNPILSAIGRAFEAIDIAGFFAGILDWFGGLFTRVC